MNDELAQPIGDIESALAAGMALADAKLIDKTPYTVLPPGHTVRELSHLLDRPQRISQGIEALDLASFLAYLTRFADTGAMVFANPATSTLRAVLDYHEPAAPSWCTHTLRYACPPSLEWQAWAKHNGKLLSLADFAEHIERNLPDITAPDPAAVLEISRGLTGKKDVKFTQAHRLSDGSFELAYEEIVTAQSRKGNHQVPPTITLGLRPYVGSEPFSIEARLRYRLENGGIAIGYELIRPERILETKFSEICAQITAAGWTVLQANIT